MCRLEFLFSTWEKRLFHYHPRLIEKFREIIADPNAPCAYCSDDKFIQDTDILCKICTFLNLRQICLSSDVLKEICTQLNFVCSQSPSGSRADGISDVVDLVSKKISLLYKSCKYAEKSLTLPKCVAGQNLFSFIWYMICLSCYFLYCNIIMHQRMSMYRTATLKLFRCFNVPEHNGKSKFHANQQIFFEF